MQAGPACTCTTQQSYAVLQKCCKRAAKVLQKCCHPAALEGAGVVQVSHHPPVGAAHAENKDWEYDMVSAPTTKFLGNSIDIYPIGQFLPFTPSTLSTLWLSP